jgi:hypothetical protein
MPSVDEGTVCILGAGGPVGAAIYPVLRQRYTLRLADIVPVEEIVARPDSPPWPKWRSAPEPPHEWRLCDVTEYRQVQEALQGCDAAINLTVNRTDPTPAFRINVVGAYNVMKAAAEHKLRRVIHTGPWSRVNGYEGDYRYEFRIPDDAPYRAGTMLYPHTKGISLEVVNAFAEQAGLDVMTFWLSRLRPARRYDGRDNDVMISFSVAWEDLGDAFLCGLRAPELPRPNEVFFICSRLPMGKYAPDKAERLLGWTPKHNFEQFYDRKVGCPGPRS